MATAPDLDAGKTQRPEGRCVLIVAPFGRDAQSVAKLLEQAGHEAVICADLRELGARIDARTGAVLLTQEALAGGWEGSAAGDAAAAAAGGRGQAGRAAQGVQGQRCEGGRPGRRAGCCGKGGEGREEAVAR